MEGSGSRSGSGSVQITTVRLWILEAHKLTDPTYPVLVPDMESCVKPYCALVGQTGMCGGVRGVSAGGVVSSAFCLLFKLHTLRMTKKQARPDLFLKGIWSRDELS
jgi:hypothetical protein